MNTEFFDALMLLEKEKGISADYLLEKIKNAIAIAVKRDFGEAHSTIVEIDKENASFKVSIGKQVVNEVENPEAEINIDEARRIDPRAELDSIVEIPLETKQFGRIAAQTAKHVIRQGIREAERGLLLKEFQNSEHEILSAVVSEVDRKKGNVTLEIGKTVAILPRSEQIEGEHFTEGERTKVYVTSVTEGFKGPKIMISRTHPGLVKRLFELEVPEVYDGTVEIKSISREAGSRTKLAVTSKNPDVDPVGSCIGSRGARIAKILDELAGEKIDIVCYSDDPVKFITASLSPAQAFKVMADKEEKTSVAFVPDNQLSLAIGNRGQNVRLAARLTGYKIDIKPKSQYAAYMEENGLTQEEPAEE